MTGLLEVRDLKIEFKTDRGVVRAVDGISFGLDHGETLGIVGESGCGKTVTALSLLGLIPSPPGRIAGGEIRFGGRNLANLPESQMRRVRGKEIAMIFQEPMTALNPVLTVGSQMGEVIRRHKGVSRRDARGAAIDLLKLVRIPSPEKRIDDYPHELSGGMRQRVMIAMALSCSPKLLIADEPTTALDVTTQAQVLEQIRLLQEEFQMSLILVTHDIGVIAETCRRVVVMYCGRIVETAPVETIFRTPRHWYTKGLFESIPRIREKKIAVLPTIEGMVPDLLHLPAGCAFADRCPRVQTRCRESIPPLEKNGEQAVACFYPNEGSN
jgi:oligopeptide/dipeptide ABC transporter ATP-binding protein